MENPILAPLISALTTNLDVLIPAFLFLWLIRSSWFKGVVGEWIVALGLKLGLGDEYVDFHDVTLEYKDGTTQIDHVLVSPYGIFVVETKNYSGWIFGSPDQRQWTQKLGGKSFRFQNPLHQNAKHVNALAETLGVDKDKIVSVVVFIGGSSIRTQVPPNICEGFAFVSYIRSFKIQHLDDVGLERIKAVLVSKRLKPGVVTSIQHRRNVKSSIDNPSCPMCGNDMKKRTAKKGKNAGRSFWGCLDFPRCRGTRVAV